MGELPTFPVEDKFGPALLRALGSFWYYYFGDRDRLQSLFRGQGQQQGQAFLDFCEAATSISRLEIPVFHEENWFQLTLSTSQKAEIFNVYEPDALDYDPTSGVNYGDAQTAEFLFPLPESDFFGTLKNIPYVLLNTVLFPSKTWVNGTDFDIDFKRRLIRFREDPFESEFVARRDVYDDDGNLVDEEVGLWIYKGQWDRDYVFNHWGFAVGKKQDSSQLYKDFVNAMWDNYVLGATIGGMQRAIAAMLGVPLVIEAQETVEQIYKEPTRTLVMTDKHVYEFAPGANVTVVVGEQVTGGDSLTDGVTVIDLAGQDPDTAGLTALSVDEGFLSDGYFGALVFENMLVDVEFLGKDQDNKSVVTFQVQGFPADVERFFEQAQATAKAESRKTLAELLDTRDSPVGQPLPESLPAQLNPMEFVLDNIMRNHLWVVRVKASAIRDDSLGLSLFRQLRNVVPPHTTYIVFVEIEAVPDTIDLSAAGDDATPGAEDIPSRFDGIPVDSEELLPTDESPDGPSYEDIVVDVFPVSEVCE